MKEINQIYRSKPTLTVIAIFLLLLICIAYSNHFNNDFEFDDNHSIVNNMYIRDISNIPNFFKSYEYQGTNPGNQDYRPIVATFHTIDYWLAGSLDSFYFHLDIFFFYLVQLVLMFIMFYRIFDLANPSEKNKFFAILSVGFYGVHTANAETINYICMRSDSFSTLAMVASLILYMIPKTRKYFLYIITLLISIGAKEAGVMFGPILFFYILFFEENVSLPELVTLKKLKNIFNALVKSLPALLFSFGTFYFIGNVIFAADPTSTAATPPEFSARWQYFYTQWVVITHYIGNFILPLELSVDTTFVLLDSVINQKVLLSLAVILLLVSIGFISSQKKETRPIAFGIMWFFIALAPTSTFIPFGQISNDHRTFFPYVGLVLSLGWAGRLLYLRYEEIILRNKYIFVAILSSYILLISLHAYGTYQRNKVWGSSEELWHDAALKGPKNGRAQMNYGLSLMQKGDYEGTLPYFQKTLQLNPYWAYIHINMGILREAMGFHEEAEQYYKNAILYQPLVPDGYYFYARWLHGKNRVDEAIEQLNNGHKLSPGHTKINEYLNSLSAQKSETPEEKINKQKKLSEENPTAANFIELSLTYYKNGKFNECISACEEALKIEPNSTIAYNNMCSAYNALEQWKKAETACLKALEIDPTFDRAGNNLKWAQKNLGK